MSVATVLAIETSCDETAAAVMRGDALLSSEVASQIALHALTGGVVPEVALSNCPWKKAIEVVGLLVRLFCLLA